MEMEQTEVRLAAGALRTVRALLPGCSVAAGLVLNVTVDKVVRMLPPLVMSEAEGREVLNRFLPLARAFLEKRAAA